MLHTLLLINRIRFFGLPSKHKKKQQKIDYYHWVYFC